MMLLRSEGVSILPMNGPIKGADIRLIKPDLNLERNYLSINYC